MTPTEARAKIQSVQSVLRARGNTAGDRKIPAIVTALRAGASAGLDPSEVADAAGVSIATVSLWARGRAGSKRPWPELEAALRAAGWTTSRRERAKGGQTRGLFRAGREPAAAKSSQAAQEASSPIARPRWARGATATQDAAVAPLRVDATYSVDCEDGSILVRIRPGDHRYVDAVRELGRGLSSNRG